MVGSVSGARSAQPRPVKVLFLASSPDDRSLTYEQDEYTAISDALKAGRFREHFKLLEPVFHVDWERMYMDIRAGRPDIVHLCCHGKAGHVILETAARKSSPTDSTPFLKLIKYLESSTMSSPLRCIVLTGCESSSLAQEIAGPGRIVIGMQGKINPLAAVNFVAGFYTHVFDVGEDLAKACDLGKAAIAGEYPDEADFPAVYPSAEEAGRIRFVTLGTILADQGGEKSRPSALEPGRVRSPDAVDTKRKGGGAGSFEAPGSKTLPPGSQPPLRSPLVDAITKTQEHLQTVSLLAAFVEDFDAKVVPFAKAESNDLQALQDSLQALSGEEDACKRLAEQLSRYVDGVNPKLVQARSSLGPVSKLTKRMLKENLGAEPIPKTGRLHSLVVSFDEALMDLRMKSDRLTTANRAQCLIEISGLLQTLKSTQTEFGYQLAKAREEVPKVLTQGVTTLKNDVSSIEQKVRGEKVRSH